MGETALEVNHVSIDYKNLMHMSMHQALLKKDVKRADIVRAVDDVSFSVEKGKILGIVGRNGSGKTTLLRSIAGIFRPDEGWIDTKGNRVSLMAIGIGFNPNNTGRENILKSGMLLGCSLDYVKEHMEEIIEFSELGDCPITIRTSSPNLRCSQSSVNPSNLISGFFFFSIITHQSEAF